MKRILSLWSFLLVFFFIEAQITYFSASPDAWVDGKDVKARLYSCEIRSGQTVVTIELVPKKNKGRLNFWTSPNTIVQAANGKVELPILGFLRTKNGESYYHTDPFNGDWGWSKVKKDESYRYSMVFDGIIPPGVTDFALRDRGTYSGAHGYQFWNYKLNNPPKGETNYKTEDLIRNRIDATPNDPFVGIYEGFGGNRYKLACIKEDGEYVLLYISDKDRRPWWNVGDIKAILKKSATPGFFKADWLLADKSYTDNAYVSFDGGSMKTVVGNEEDGYLKMYTSSQSYNPNIGGNGTIERWSGTGFALSNGYIATNYHVIEDAKSIYVQGIHGDFNISYNAEIIASDKFNDLALLRIKDSRFKGFGEIPYSVKTGIAEVGEDIYVLGYPLTSTMGDEIKLTTGIISAKTGFQGDVSLYQISAPIQPGNSGGPLFDSNGNVIGIVNAKHQGAENVGYAIKASYLRNLIESSISQSILPSSNTVSSLPLTGKVKSEKKFVFMISCSNQASSTQSSPYYSPNNNSGPVVVNNPKVASTTSSRTFITKVIANDRETIIEFNGNNSSITSYYTWITISPNSYIMANGQKYKLKSAEGIGIDPKKTYFDKPNTDYTFKLIFPPIPLNVSSFDFIESPDSDWKFYGVKIR